MIAAEPKQTETKPFEEQRKLAMLLTVWQIPSLVTNFIAAAANRSLVLWMEFVETMTIVLPAILLIAVISFMRKNLKFRFNYGTGKIEDFTALICQVFDIGGLLLIFGFAIRNLIHAQDKHHNLVLAIILEIVGVGIAALIQYRMRIIKNRTPGKIAETFYISIRKELFFGLVSTVTLIVTYFREETVWSRYLSPVVCLALTLPFLFIVFHHILHSAHDLLDEALEEEIQLKILKILSEFFDEYTELDDVRSRRSGEMLFIDIHLVFDENRTYKEIRDVSRRIEKRLEEEIGSCDVSIVIC